MSEETPENPEGGDDSGSSLSDWSEDEDVGYGEYYSFNDEEGRASQFNNNDDPEYFNYECLTAVNVEKIFNEYIQTVKSTLGVSHARAKQLLHSNKWNVQDIIEKYSPVRRSPSMSPPSSFSTAVYCGVCASNLLESDFASPKGCRHKFCKGCWQMHFEIQINQGVSTMMSCMSPGCDTLVDEDLILSNLRKAEYAAKYKHLSFLDYVRCHPNLRFCPGPNCPIVIKAAECVSKNTVCVHCKARFCFKCGNNYHAPTDCETIRRWLTKCADDSETANYISANTKDCPKCNICIEKNGGCNHMQCVNCKHEFCWMCLGDWRTHGSEYYECSRYKENPNIAHESAHAQAREALKKYLHYFERWENHSRSMKLEAATLDKIKNRITEKVMSSCGTWIDWQYLFDASSLLAKCRYTLQYTYPYAYYIEPSSRKELFEYQQAQLEAEIENLSWKIEHAETTDRGDLENQMDIAEKLRTSLLKDFLKT